MVHPSNPRLMTRVLDAVSQLCDGKGSSAREILDFIRQASKTSPRNLTMQVHRALKHAVNAGLLRHRSGRYKALFTLNPAPINQDVSQNSDDKIVDKESDVSKEKQADDTDSVQRTQSSRMKRSKKKNNRRQRRTSSREKKRNRRRRSRSKSNGPTERIEKIRHRTKSRYKQKKENIGESRTHRRYDATRAKINRSKRNMSPALNNRRRSKTTARVYCSDSSDNSDCETQLKGLGRKTPVRYEQCTHYEADGKSKARSRSRSRSLQQQNPSSSEQQLRLQTKHSSETLEKHRSAPDNPELLNQANEKNQESNNSGSGSTM